MDGLTEEQFYEKKTQLMRKLTAKATKFLYENEKKELQKSSTASLGGRKLFDEKKKVST